MKKEGSRKYSMHKLVNNAFCPFLIQSRDSLIPKPDVRINKGDEVIGGFQLFTLQIGVNIRKIVKQ